MERTSRLSITSRTDVFETRHDTRTAGTGFSPADIALEASASALEATATRGFDFMEDMPLNARGRTGKRGGPRGDKRTAPDCAGGSGGRVASLVGLLQELSSPRAPSSTTTLGRTPPRATACPPASSSFRGSTSSRDKTASTGLREASGAADRHELETHGETEGTRLRSFSGRENALAQSSLGEPARPVLRVDDPRAFASKEARGVNFAGTRAPSLEHATIGTAAPPPAPPVTLLDEQWPVSGSAAIIPSRPKRPTGIQGTGSAKGRRPHRDLAQGATKRVALGNVTPGNSRGGDKRAPAALTASAARSEALPKMASSVGYVHASEDESGSEERSSKRRHGYARELQGGSTLVGAAGRSESKRRDVVVGVRRLSRGEPARGREGGGWVSPAERAVEQMPRVGTGSKQGVPQGGYGAPTGRGGTVVDSRTNQDRATGMWMWQDEGDLLDSEQQGSIESQWQSQAPEVQSAEQVRSIRPASKQAERKLGIERQDEGRAAAAVAVADTGGSALMERRDGGPAERQARILDNGEKEWSYGAGAGAGDNREEEEGHKADPKRDLVRVRGLCHMRGAILALVEWSVVDTEGSAGTELSFMLSSALRSDWPQQYITFLEERMVFNTEEEAHGTRGEAPGNPPSAAVKGMGSALELWKPGQPTTSRLPA